MITGEPGSIVTRGLYHCCLLLGASKTLWTIAGYSSRSLLGMLGPDQLRTNRIHLRIKQGAWFVTGLQTPFVHRLIVAVRVIAFDDGKVAHLDVVGLCRRCLMDR